MEEQTAQARVVLSFGRFALFPNERLLTEDGAPVELGARTLDTLIVLVTRPNQVVGKRELMAEVWPDVTVEEGSLRFHIASLRKALGDGRDGTRYIATLAGRGYCFVAQVAQSGVQVARDVAVAPYSPKVNFLPAPLMRMVGRSEEVGTISTQLATSRFVTVVGYGGIGKTTVAVAVAHDLLDAFADGAIFVDLGELSDPDMAAPYLASILGLSVQSDDPTPSITAYLRERHMLLILDNCEHLIESAAKLAASIFVAAPMVHILATSREALRVDGEWVHRLTPLALPADDTGLTAADALTFPATRLFVEQAVASGARIEFGDRDAPIVASICRKLDGVALAIKLAAGRVAAYGLEQTAALLDQRLALQWPGKRTSPQRQKSLNATLDWSYSLLSELERLVLRRLAQFVGHFTLDAAQAVTTSATIDTVSVLNAIESLVGKSMVATHPVGTQMRYRLLDTTRAYVLEIGMDNGERADLAARHAIYYQQWLEQIAKMWLTLSNAAQRPSLFGDLNNVSAALEWCFGGEGNAEIGVNLAAAAAPVLFAMSLLTECQRWSQQAILALDDTTLGTRKEMRLQAALGLSLMWTQGNSEAAYAALNRSIAIAEEQGDNLNQIQLITPLHVFHMRIGKFRTAMQYAEKVAALSQNTDDPSAIALSRILTGYSHHFAGDLAGARRDFEAALRLDLAAEKTHQGRDSQSVMMKDDALAAPILGLASAAASSALARTLWLQGYPARALGYVRDTLIDTVSAEHPATATTATMYAIAILLWNGDLDAAEEQIMRFISIAETLSLKSHVVLGRCFQGQLAISRGDSEAGIELLQASLEDLQALRYEMWTTAFHISLLQAFVATGRFTKGMAFVDETIRLVEANGDLCYMPELLRLKAELYLSVPQAMPGEAENCLTESLALSRRQGARAWELRTSIDVAKRLADNGRPDEARAFLKPVIEQFDKGSDTADLRAGKSLLAGWSEGLTHL